ncbi:hypothetical protein O6H91_12G003700 [Diphasiastrum complanatum]|uniref:Uncharacterized protein n=2 Tax=Diphasiastrum complanatum TaxID=34168 RepID=A0ACC2BYG9_DIPCM|nr:hypothetical protein O6H91_12G003700 [Diphasiastrum complanatum]KAJ7534796.1 hypothetical protein O6H91_12G003700 [Diphasiastrum complanatum]
MAIKLVLHGISSASRRTSSSLPSHFCSRFVSISVLAKDPSIASNASGSIASAAVELDRADDLQLSRNDTSKALEVDHVAGEAMALRSKYHISNRTVHILSKHDEPSLGFQVTSRVDRPSLGFYFRKLSSMVENLEVVRIANKDGAAVSVDQRPLLKPIMNRDYKRLQKYLCNLGIGEDIARPIMDGVPEVLYQIRRYSRASTLARFAGVLSDYGFKQADMKTLVLKNPLLLSSFFSGKLNSTLRVLRDLGLPDECVRQILQKHPSILKQNRGKALIARIQYWQSVGLDHQNLMKVVATYPAILNFNVEQNLKPKLEYLQSFGLSNENVVRIVQRIPYVVTYSIEKNIKPKMEYLESFGLIKEQIGKMLNKHPHFLRCSIERCLKPTIHFLVENGLHGKALVKLLIRQPQILGRSVKRSLVDRMQLIKNLGFERESSKLATVIFVTNCLSLKTLQGRYDHLLSLGLSKSEVYKILKSQPEIYGKSTKDIDQKVEYLVKVLNHPITVLVKIPVYLLYSLEKRIKPRHQLLSWLYSIGSLKKEYCLSTILTMSESSFSSKFVELHPDGATVYHTDSGRLVIGKCVADSGNRIYKLT